MEISTVKAAKNGDEDEFFKLLSAYSPLIDSMTVRYSKLSSAPDADYDDFRQEAVLAFYDAVMAFDTEQTKVSFGLYSKICIRNRLVSFLRKCSSKKRRIDADELYVSSPSRDSKELLKSLSNHAEDALTEYENSVFRLYLCGVTYHDIALKLGKSEKSVDNALFRAKKKLRSGYSV